MYLSKQEHGESASAFGLRLQIALCKARDRGGISPDSVDDTLHIVFWQGLSDEQLRNAIRHKIENVKSFDEVMRIVRAAEQEIYELLKFHKNAKSHQKFVQSNLTQQNQKSDTDSLQKTLEALTKRLDQLDRTSLAKQETKGDMGTVKDQPGGLQGPNRNYQQGIFRCYKCGQEGHIARGCRSQPTREWAEKHLNGKGALHKGGQ